MLSESTPSVERAVIMAILAIFANIIHKRSDTINNLTIALLVILIENPFKITSISLLLSFGATIGIIIFSKLKQINQISYETETKVSIFKNIYNMMKNIISLSFACQIIILPLEIVNFHKISLTFIFSNILISPFIGIIIILGFMCCIPIKIPIITNLIINCLEILLNGLIKVSEIFSEIPLSHIYVINPGIVAVILYYTALFVILYIRYILQKKY